MYLLRHNNARYGLTGDVDRYNYKTAQEMPSLNLYFAH